MLGNQRTVSTSLSARTFLIMKLSHKDVLAAIDAWRLASVVTCKEKKGKTELTFKGETHVYPCWLAVQKVNQIGASYRCDTNE